MKKELGGDLKPGSMVWVDEMGWVDAAFANSDSAVALEKSFRSINDRARLFYKQSDDEGHDHLMYIPKLCHLLSLMDFSHNFYIGTDRRRLTFYLNEKHIKPLDSQTIVKVCELWEWLTKESGQEYQFGFDKWEVFRLNEARYPDFKVHR